MASKQQNVQKPVPGKVNVSSNNTAGSGGFLTRKVCILILALISFVVYANTFGNDYAYDDLSVMSKNTIVTKGISAIPEILSTPYRLGFFKTTNDLYRPLSQVMFAVEYQLFNGSPAQSHVINVLLFACCVILLFLCLDALFEKRYTVAAFIAALLFAVHPIHTEVVANIKGRDELLCFFFAFLSVYVFIKYVDNGKMKHLLLGLVCFFLSLLSKETSIAFLAVFPLIFLFYKNENKRRSVYIILSAIVPVITFLAIRFSVLNAYHANSTFEVPFIDNALVKASAASRMATAILILGKYISLLFVPYPLICDYSYNSIPFVGWGNVWALLSFVIYVALIIVGLYRLLKYKKDPFAFGILFFMATIALFSNIPFLIGAAMAERFVFVASAGFCWLMALALVRWASGSFDKGNLNILYNKKLLAILVPVLLIFAGIAITRNGEWTDNLTLYKADLKKAPDNARLHYFLGNELLISVTADKDPATGKQTVEDAITILKKGLLIYPDYSDLNKVLGNGYFIMGQLDSSVYFYKKAVALKPDDMEAWGNLDVVYFNAKQYQQSIDVCKKIIELDPHNTERYNNIGICYLRLEKYDSAVNILKKGMALEPGFNAFYENTALAYKLALQKDSALKYEAVARQHNPEFRIY